MISRCALMGSTAYLPVPSKLAFAPFNSPTSAPRISSVHYSSRFSGKPLCLQIVSDRRFRSASRSSILIEGFSGLTRPIGKVPKGHRSRTSITARALKDDNWYTFQYFPMTEKPKWWWRSVASLPYLMPLHQTWRFAETAYHLHPFLEDFQFLTYPFYGAMAKLPSWFMIAYFVIGIGVFRRRELPHFFRFHVLMGMLLEISLHVGGYVSKFLPSGLYWGKIGMHIWTALAFGFLFTVLECIRCALAGMYADVPFVSDAAYMQIHMTSEEVSSR